MLLFCLLPLGQAHAADLPQTTCPQDTAWRESRTQSFSVIFATEDAALAQSLITQLGSWFDETYAQFSGAFGVALPLPLSIRIYPRLIDYDCLNPFAPRLVPGDTHSHIGAREIALVGEAILSDFDSWQAEAQNAFRHELVKLFAEKLSEGIAPPGLLVGLGGYAENPNEVFESRFQGAGLEETPQFSWQELWENAGNLSGEQYLLEATSTVAYLVDVYGWGSFTDFLRALSAAGEYRQALADVYGLSVRELNEHWQQYFEVYVQGRWRANVFHSFDLTVYEQMIAAGAYADAADGLREAIALLTALGQSGAAAQAQTLLARAEQGVQAGALAAQARQELQAGNYAAAQAVAQASLDLYAQLEDERRIEEVTNYRERAEEVLQLRAEVEQLSAGRALTSPIAPRRLLQIGERLGELGDTTGVNAAALALTIVNEQRREAIAWISVGGALVSLALLWRQFRFLRRAPPVEAGL